MVFVKIFNVILKTFYLHCLLFSTSELLKIMLYKINLFYFFRKLSTICTSQTEVIYYNKLIFLPFNNFTMPVIISWISGLACRPCWSGMSDGEAKLLVIVALGVISWGSCNALAWGAPRPSPDCGTFVCSNEGGKTSLF